MADTHFLHLYLLSTECDHCTAQFYTLTDTHHLEIGLQGMLETQSTKPWGWFCWCFLGFCCCCLVGCLCFLVLGLGFFFIILKLVYHSAQLCLQLVSQQFIFSQRLHFWAQWLSGHNFSQLFWGSSVTHSKAQAKVEHGAFILLVSWGEENALTPKTLLGRQVGQVHKTCWFLWKR